MTAVAGVLFVVAGVVFLLDLLEVISISAGWLWPGLLIALGAALLVSGRRRDA